MGKGSIRVVKLYAECYMDLAFLLFILYYSKNGDFGRVEEAHKRRKFKICGKVYELSHSKVMGYAKVIDNVIKSNCAIGFIDAPKSQESHIKNLLKKKKFRKRHNKFGVSIWMAPNGGKVLILNQIIETWLRKRGLNLGKNEKITDVKTRVKILKKEILKGNILSGEWYGVIDFFTKEVQP